MAHAVLSCIWIDQVVAKGSDEHDDNVYRVSKVGLLALLSSRSVVIARKLEEESLSDACSLAYLFLVLQGGQGSLRPSRKSPFQTF